MYRIFIKIIQGHLKRAAHLIMKVPFLMRSISPQVKRSIIMRVNMIAILLFLAILQVGARGMAQPGIHLVKKDISLEQIFEEIHKQTGYNVLYSSKKINDGQRLSVNFVNLSIEQVLDKCLYPFPLTYLIKEKTILIKEKAQVHLGNDPRKASDVLVLRQNLTISGKVTDSAGYALEKATVKVRGTLRATITDREGRFTLKEVEKGAVLEISFIGFKTITIPVEDERFLQIMLAPQEELSEVVVVGYGRQKKSDLTGSIVSVKGEQLTSQAVHSPLQALAGISPGVEVLQNSGQPGSPISLRIRGSNSLLGSNDPLYVVDGFPISGSLETLNANDILSIEVLKDASATAIYGSRGANGVVMVSTKRGVANQSKIEYNTYFGVQKVDQQIEMLNAREFATLANLRAKNDGEPAYFTDAQIAAFDTGNNWQDAIFRTKPMQNHSLMISGGSERTTFSLSGNLLDQEGIILNSYFKQMQLRNTLTHTLFKGWKVSLHTILNRTRTNILRSDNSSRGNGVLSGALVAPPTLPVYAADGTYTNIRAYAFSPDIAENPVKNALERKDMTTKSNLLSNAVLEGEIGRNLTLRSSLGVEYANNRGDFYSPSIIHITATGEGSIRYNEVTNVVNENTLTYQKRFAQSHELTLLGGVTSQQTTEQGVLAKATGFQTDLLENLNLQSGNAPGIPESFRTRYAILSGLGRVNYAYKGKYLFTASLRADGSSRFGKENRWGYFPSAAVAWRVSEEKALKSLYPKLSELKIRGSWGKTGNTSIAPYQSLSVLSSMPVVFDNNLVLGFGPGNNQPNPSLKWETTNQIDVGLDMGLWQNRLLLTLDYYYKKTNDLLNSTPVAISSGYMTISRNVGSVQNKGIDASINGTVLEGPVKWNLGLNLSINRNKVLKLAGGTDIFGQTIGLPISLPVNLVREGYPVGVFFGYKEDGLTSTGEIKFVDQDQNNVINTLDRTIIGDPNPDYILGINSSIQYKRFSFSFLLHSVQGNDIFNFNASNLADGFSFGINQIKDVLGNYWTAENPNPNAKYPKISKNTRYLVSDRFVEDGSYIRLKNVQLSYNFKDLKINNFKLDHLQAYVAAQNLFTLTNYSFYSPDVSTIGAGISRGVDQFGYPDAKVFMLGLRLKL